MASQNLSPVKKLSLLHLAVPLVIESILRYLMGTVNVFMIGKYSDEAVAATGVANQVINMVAIAFTVISAGAAVLINQALGAKREREAAAISMNALSMGVGLGAFVSALLLLLGPSLIHLIGLKTALVGDAVSYLNFVGGASIFVAISAVCSAIFRCYGNARDPMLVIVFNNILNLIGSYIVIFRPFETGLVGVQGVGAVRLFTEIVGCTILLIGLFRMGCGFEFRDMVKLRFSLVKKMLGKGCMSGMEGICFAISQMVTVSFLTSYDSIMLSAKVYVQSIDNYAYLLGLAIGQATQIMAGHMMGAGEFDRAFRFVRRNWMYVFFSNLLFALIMYLFAGPILGLFTGNSEIVAIAKKLLFINVFIQMLRSLSHSFNYGLRAAGFVFLPMLVAVSSIWLLNVGLGYVFTVVFGWGVVGLWLSQLADELVRGCGATCFWFSRKWEKSVTIRASRTV